MTEAVKICATGIACAVICVIVRQLRPETEPLVQLGSVAVIGIMLLSSVKKLLAAAQELFSRFELFDAGYLELLIKVLGIAVIAKIGADICTDSGNTALASVVELAGKVTILLLCFSLIGTVTELAGGLLS